MIFSSSAGRFCQGHQVDQSLWLGGSADMLMQPWVNSRHGLQVVMRLWLTELFVVTPRGQVCNAFLVMHEVTSGTHWWNSDGKRVTSASSGQLKNYHVSGFDRPQRDGGYIRFGTLRRVSSVLMRVLMSSACSCAVRPALRWHLIHEKHASQRFVDFLDFSGWSNFQTYTMSCQLYIFHYFLILLEMVKPVRDFWNMQESLIVHEMSTFRYREQGPWYHYWFDALKILINDWVLKSLSTTWKISPPEPDGAIAGAQIDRALPKMSDVRFSPSAQLANLLDDSMSLEEVQKAVGKWLVDGFSRFWINV